MNPMVDLAFLLVTFFMLTTTFRTVEPVTVDMPESQSEMKLPESDVLTIIASKEGQFYVGLDKKPNRVALLDLMGKEYGYSFSAAEAQVFAIQNSVGMPMEKMGSFLSLDSDLRPGFQQPGIPIDSTGGELKDWILMARVVNPSLKIAIKGDEGTPYPVIKELMDLLQDNDITRYSFITDLEREANDV